MRIYLDRKSLKVYDELIPAGGCPQRLGAACRWHGWPSCAAINWVDACVDPGAAD